MLLNLVRNGLEAMPEGGRLVIAARRATGGVALSVSDDGPGIAATDLERMFEPYFTTKAGGTGLGLAIAQRIARGARRRARGPSRARRGGDVHAPAAWGRGGRSGPPTAPASP